MIVHHDFETRSRCDLKSCGQHRYAIDPSTEALMCAVSEAGSDKVWLWIAPGLPVPEKYRGHNPEAERLLAEATLLYAHSIPFEQAMHWGLHERGAPSPFKRPPPLETLRCTAAMARKAGLPSSLEQLGAALNLSIQKDNKGKALIRFFSLPNKEGNFNEPKDHLEKWEQFCDYCVTDVVTEKLSHKKLKPFELQGLALECFLFDLKLNQSGIPINLPAAMNAQKIIEQVQTEVAEEFQKITGLNPTQREKVRLLVNSYGVELPDMQAETLEAVQVKLEEEINEAGMAGYQDDVERLDQAQRVLELYSKLSFAALKKIAAMIEMACPDGRVRGCHVYHGTGPGRWAAKGLQPQNFKKTPPWMRKITDQVYKAICDGHGADTLDLLYGNPMELISGCIRHFIHLPGTEMFDADYSAIQARGICWLAGEESILKMWREGRDLYKFMASEVYGIPEGQVDDDQRSFGKVIELACGFQMGPEKFKATCESWGAACSTELAEKGVETYRRLHPNVVKYWYFLDNSCRSAIANPGQTFGPFTVRTISGIPYLLARNPSGRSLAYPHPRIEPGLDAKGNTREQITYWGASPYSTQWGRIKLYGGKLAENLTMSVEADIMAHGLITADKLGFESVAVIHDQALALKKEGQTIQQFVSALTTLPSWAKGFPLKSDGRVRPYYSK